MAARYLLTETERIVDVVKVIGKRRLSYRQVENEATYTLEDSSIDHGNLYFYWENMSALKSIISNCIEKSKNCISLGQEAEVPSSHYFPKHQSIQS